MNTLIRRINPVTLAILGTLCIPPASAELVDEAWIVRSGDGLYGIARKLAPKDLKMQARIRSEITQINPRLNPNALEIGMSLKLPDFLFEKQVKTPPPPAVPVKAPELPGPVQISKKATVTPDPEDVIGRVVIQSGNMVAENRGSTRQLNRTANILKGDTLKTAGNARSQVRLKDGALIAISPDTELKFEDFAYNGSEDGSERSVLNLIKGGFRTITGAIGHTNKQNYQVKTSVATIGIRGTHYGLMLCEAGSCQNNPEAGNLNDGLYGGVVDGSIVTNNDAGSMTFNNDQYFHIQTALTLPVETLLPPPVFQDTPPQGDQAPADMANGPKPLDPRRPGMGNPPPGGLADTGPGQLTGTPPPIRNPFSLPVNAPNFTQPYGFVATSQQPSDPNNPGNIGNTALPTPAPSGSGIAVSFTGIKLGLPDAGAGAIYIRDGNPNAIFLETITDANGNVIRNLPFALHEEHNLLDQNGNIIGRETHDAVRTRPDGTGAVYNLASLGGNGLYGVNWGRWNGNYVLLENGLPDTTDNNFHFIYSDRLTPKDTLFNLGGLKTRVEVYRIIGGTAPTDNLGNVAPSLAVVDLSASLDFVTQQMLSYNLSISNFNSSITDIQYWTGSTAGPVPFTALGDSFQLSNSANAGCPNCLGDASVMFVGNTANALMSSYGIYDNVTHSYALSGVALLAPQLGAVGNGTSLLVAARDAATSTSFAATVAPGSRDNVYIGADFLGTTAPVTAIDHYIGTDTLSHYNTLTVNPSLATAIVNSTITPGVLTTAGVSAYWGRWDAATVRTDVNNLQDVTTHFIGSSNMTTPTQLGGLTGTATYSVANLGTAYDANYNGTPVTAGVTVGMTADFTNQQITAFNVNVNGLITGALQQSTGGNPVPFTQLNQDFGLVDSAFCTGCSPRGTASVQFVGSGAQGALTSFSLSDTVNTAAGVALLTQ